MDIEFYGFYSEAAIMVQKWYPFCPETTKYIYLYVLMFICKTIDFDSVVVKLHLFRNCNLLMYVDLYDLFNEIQLSFLKIAVPHC